jgi:hypothetical protein
MSKGGEREAGRRPVLSMDADMKELDPSYENMTSALPPSKANPPLASIVELLVSQPMSAQMKLNKGQQGVEFGTSDHSPMTSFTGPHDRFPRNGSSLDVDAAGSSAGPSLFRKMCPASAASTSTYTTSILRV